MIHCPGCGRLLVSERPLTKRQLEVYKFLIEFGRDHGYAASLEDIAAAFNLSSVATVSEHLRNIEAKGYIKREYNESRSIVCLVHPDEIASIPLIEAAE